MTATEQYADVVTLADLRTLADARKAEPLVRHFDKDLGKAFYVKKMTGEDLDTVFKLMDGDNDKFNLSMAMVGVAKPSIGPIEWAFIKQQSPSVEGRLILAIREAAGMLDNDLEQAKNGSGREVATSSTGIVSPANSDTAASETQNDGSV